MRLLLSSCLLLFLTHTVLAQELPFQTGHANFIHAVKFSPDQTRLLSYSFAVGGKNQNLFFFEVETGHKLWQLLPAYQPSAAELRLDKEKEQRRISINELKAQRDQQAALDAVVYKKQVFITFEHYGEMADPGEQRLMESDEPNRSKAKKPAAESNAVWLRLHNDSPLPIEIPTQSMYLPNPNCFYPLSSGKKALGLCDKREISVWFGLGDKDGKALRYGFDFGATSRLLPGTSALFPVPREILKGGKAISFEFKFQKENNKNAIEDYGKALTLRFREADLPKE